MGKELYHVGDVVIIRRDIEVYQDVDGLIYYPGMNENIKQSNYIMVIDYISSSGFVTFKGSGYSWNLLYIERKANDFEAALAMI